MFGLVLAVCGCSGSSTSKGSPRDAGRDGAVDSGPMQDGGASHDGSGGVDGAGSDATLDVTSPADAADAPSADAGPPAVRFLARVDSTDPAGPRFAWSGSTVVARFTGPTVGVQLADNGNYWGVFIDGTSRAQPLITTNGQPSYPLASGLAAGPHELRLYRLTEANQGDTQFLGLTLDPSGALLPPSLPPLRRIEVVGDSISCGYGDTGMGPNCSFSLATENHYLSYGAVTARALGAELITTAWSGKGMYRNYGGDMTDTMPTLYLRTLPDQAASVWSFATWTPDVVVINLGTNDFAQGDPGQPYVDAYLAFVRLVRMNYPGAYIECTNGPMLGDPNLTTARGYINSVVSTMKSGGDTKIGYLEFPTQNGTANGLGCDYHPTVVTHQMMADQLTAALKTALSW